MKSESYEAAAFLLRQLPDLPEGVLHEDYIDFPTLSCERRWSTGEWTLILAAQDIYNGGGDCTLRQILTNLDDSLFAAVVHAMEMRRPQCFTTNLVRS